MADDVKLLAVIDANTKAFENALKRIERSTNATFGKADQSVRRLERTLQASSTRLTSFGRNFSTALLRPLAALAGAQGLSSLINSFQRIENALKIAGVEGEEFDKVLQSLTKTATQNGAPLESLVQLYGQLALSQKDLGISTEEVLEFTNGVAAALKISGRSAEAARGALLQLSQIMGSAVVRSEEFNSVQEGARPILQAVADGLEEAGGSVAKLRGLVIDGLVPTEAFFRAFQAGQGNLQALADTADLTLGQAFENLITNLTLSVGELDKATGSSVRLKDALIAVGNAVNFVTIKLGDLAASDFGSKIGDMADAIGDAGAKTRLLVEGFFAGKFKGDAGHEFVQHIVDTGADILRAEDKLRTDVEKLKDNPIEVGDLVALPSQQADRAVSALEAIDDRVDRLFNTIGEANRKVDPVSLTDFPPPKPPKPPGKSQADRDREAAARAIDREREAVKQLISDLEFERSLIGLSNEQREIEIALRRAGAVATEEQRAQITSLVASGIREQEALDQLIDRMDELRNAAGGALDAFAQSIASGEGATAGLKAALVDLLQTIIQIGEQQAIKSLFGAIGTAGGGGIGGIIGGLFGGAGAQTGGGAAVSRLPTPTVANLAGSRSLLPRPAVVELSVVEGALFRPVVTGISQGVSVRQSGLAEQRAVARGPAVARDAQRRFGTP